MTKAKQYFARSSAAIQGALKKLATRGSATRPINNLYNFLEKTSRSEAKCSSRKNAENSLCAKITKVDLLFNVKLFVFSRKNIMLVDFDGLLQKNSNIFCEFFHQ